MLPVHSAAHTCDWPAMPVHVANFSTIESAAVEVTTAGMFAA